MNEVSTAEQPTKPAKPPLVAGAAAAGIVPTSIEEVARLAKVAIDAGLMGKDTKYDTAEQKLPRAMMIIMQGLELQLKPMQALNGIALINGKPSPWGKLARALVLRAGHKVEEHSTGTPYDPDYTCHCKVTRGDSGQVTEKSFSVQDAIDANLWQTSPTVEKKDWDTGKLKLVPNDSPWYRYKKDMLAARAFSRAAIGVADSLLGMEIAEVLRDVEEHRSDREEDRGKVSAVAAPPPPLADDAEYLRDVARKPPETDPERVEPEKPKAPPTPAEEKVPEHAGPDMKMALVSLEVELRAAKSLDEAERVLEQFNANCDGYITTAIESKASGLFEARVSEF